MLEAIQVVRDVVVILSGIIITTTVVIVGSRILNLTRTVDSVVSPVKRLVRCFTGGRGRR